MSAHAHLPPDPIPPPKLVFTISHYKEVLDDLTGKTHTEYFCRLEISYPPRVSKKDQIHNILRRWSHFAWFDNEWARIYPMLHEQCKLPVKTSFTSVFNKSKLADTRRVTLQQYIQKLLTINCLQEFVAQFLEIDYSHFKSVDPRAASSPLTISTSRDGALSPSGPSSPLPSEVSGPQTATGLRIINNTEYVKEGPEKKGNTGEASKKAHKMKAKFLEENKELVDQILQSKAKGDVPSIKLNLPFLGTGRVSNPAMDLLSPSSASPPPIGSSVNSSSPLADSSPKLSPHVMQSPSSAPLQSPLMASSPPPLRSVPPTPQLASSPPPLRSVPPTPQLASSPLPMRSVPPLPNSTPTSNTNSASKTTPPPRSLVSPSTSPPARSSLPPPPVPTRLQNAQPPPLQIVRSGPPPLSSPGSGQSPSLSPPPFVQRPKKGSFVIQSSDGGLLSPSSASSASSSAAASVAQSPPPITSLPPRPSLTGGPPPLPSSAPSSSAIAATSHSSQANSGGPPPIPTPRRPSSSNAPPPLPNGPPALPTSKPNVSSLAFGKRGPPPLAGVSPQVASVAAVWKEQPGAVHIATPPKPLPVNTPTPSKCANCAEPVLNLNARFCCACGMPLKK